MKNVFIKAKLGLVSPFLNYLSSKVSVKGFLIRLGLGARGVSVGELSLVNNTKADWYSESVIN